MIPLRRVDCRRLNVIYVMRMEALKKRQEFIRAARHRDSRKWVTPTVIVQAIRVSAFAENTAEAVTENVEFSTENVKSPSDEPVVKVGFTATKRLGNAVKRNRIRRRLRAAAQEVLPMCAKSGYAYVFIGRASTLDCPYQCLLDDMKTALVKLHARHKKRG